MSDTENWQESVRREASRLKTAISSNGPKLPPGAEERALDRIDEALGAVGVPPEQPVEASS